MASSTSRIIARIGSGEPISAVCSSEGLSTERFDELWRSETTRRVPDTSGSRSAPVRDGVEIVRDEWGIPTVFASNDIDLFFGYGYAMAQDRLWQLDYYRRRAMGRLSEVLGPDGLDLDVVARTVGINRIAREQVETLPGTTLLRLDAFSRGINAVIEDCQDRIPIEFDLLDYRPEPWRPLDSVAVWAEFRWYLTGRLPVIALPELARRVLGDGPHYQAFLTGEAEGESIVPPGSYPPRRRGFERVGATIGGPDEGLGSNNWVVSARRSESGAPMVSSDPHIAFGAVSCWYEVHLSGGPFNVVGAGYVGVPGVIFGRNERVAWGVTNNICSQRDLYLEKAGAGHSDGFVYDGEWQPERSLVEEIDVRGGDSVRKTVRFSRNGPIVNELLPEPARIDEPVSLRWLGAAISDEISCLHNLNQAANAAELRQALRPWAVPTWSFGFADVEGHTGYQCVGRIPIRDSWDRGFRRGWDPDDEWRELVPFDGLPALADPAEGWVRSANNRAAPEDFPYPLSGTWSSGHRAARIRAMIEEKDRLSRQDFARMQTDVLSLRAVEGVPRLLEILSASDARMRQAATLLESWGGRMEPDSAAAAVFEMFFDRWTEAVAAERFPADAVDVIAGAVSGLALELLDADTTGWFRNEGRDGAAVTAVARALDDLEDSLGPDMSTWAWGSIHTLNLDHLLSERGDLGSLLSRGGQPAGGNGVTVCNTGHDPNYLAAMGANYRLVAELADSPPGLWAVDAAGQSGHPGSPHYCDQTADWLEGRHHYLPLDRERVLDNATNTLELTPES